MVLLEAQEWYYGLLPPDDLATYLKKPGDFLVRCWDNGDGVELCLSIKKESIISTETGTIRMSSNENISKLEECSDEKAHAEKEHKSNIHHYVICFNDGLGWSLEKDKRIGFNDVDELVHYYHINNLPEGGKLIRGSPRPKYLLKHHQVSKRELLGSGNFCDVYRGILNKRQEIAVKICHNAEGNVKEEINKATESLIEEGRIMSRIDHPNIVKFMGLCCDIPPVMMLMELCVCPLIGHIEKEGEKITHGERIRYSIDVAEGMSYLQSKNLVHRDLAARNCLFSKRGICKIADFGLSKLMRNLTGEKTGTAQMPVRWMAPETLQTSPVFSPKSDIWSYGVLLFEIFTNGNKPFDGDEWPLKKVATYIRKGKMVDPPENAPAEIQDLMKECWRINPEERMDFDAIAAHLKESQTKYPQPQPDELVIAQIPGIILQPIDAAPLLEVIEVEEVSNAIKEKVIMLDAKKKRRSRHQKDKRGDNHQQSELDTSTRRQKQSSSRNNRTANSSKTTHSKSKTTQSISIQQRCSGSSRARRSSSKQRKQMEEESSHHLNQIQPQQKKSLQTKQRRSVDPLSKSGKDNKKMSSQRKKKD